MTVPFLRTWLAPGVVFGVVSGSPGDNSIMTLRRAARNTKRYPFTRLFSRGRAAVIVGE
jgi:hypothetical protein